MKTQRYIQNIAASGLMLMVTATLPPAARAKTVQVPPGSGTLAAAINQAGPHGKVVLQEGVHSEVGELVVSFPITIVGEPGAILETATAPATAYPILVTAALHFQNAPGATVEGVWFRPPAGTIGNCAVILEDSPAAQVLNNQMTGLQYGVFVQGSDNAVIRGNVIDITTAWETALPDAEGIISNVGHHVLVLDNQISNAEVGVFVSDRSGELQGNTVLGCMFGVECCHNRAFPAPYDTLYYMFSALIPLYGPEPANAWHIHHNTVHGGAWGVLVIDGSHNNVLANNDALGNGQVVLGMAGYDIELLGDTYEFGPFTPACYDNRVTAGEYHGIVVHNCGKDNAIHGHVILSTDPCN